METDSLATNTGGAKSIRFVLPNLPPSMNVLYQPTFRAGRMTGMKMQDGARRWQQSVMLLIPRFTVEAGATLQIDMAFYFDWSKRRFDCANLTKLILDTVAAKLGFNDKIVRHGSWRSVNSKKEYVEVRLSLIEAS